MHIFRDEIVLEEVTSNIEHHSDNHKDYDPWIEKDIGDHDSEERGDINESNDDDPLTRFDKLGEEAPPYPSKMDIVPKYVPTNTTSKILMVSKKRKTRGPTKKHQSHKIHALGIQCIGSTLWQVT